MPRPLTDRVENLETKMLTLQELPGQVTELTARVTSLESQFFQFRAEVKAEFLQFRADVKEEFLATRNDVRDGDEETRRFMRVLYEDLIARIMTIRDR